MTGSARPPEPIALVDPGTTLSSVVAGVSPDQSYVDPTAAEREAAGTGLARLAIGDLAGATELLGPLGFTITDGVDQATGRRFATALSETATARAWGVYLADLSAPLRLCVAVPHPRSDARCEQLALRLWRAVPGSMLAMAAVHRDAVGKTADHSRNTASVFHHLWTTALGPRGVPQVQIHGFADTTAPEQVAVSTGVGPATPAAVRIADEIAATGLATTRSWEGTTHPRLRATTNVQGIAADSNDWIWVHVEHNRTVRDTETLWHPAIDAVAAANPTLLAYDRPSPGGPGHTPRSIGRANAAGTSRYLAREDHTHRGATAGHTHTPAVVRTPPVTLVDATTITVDSSEGDYFRVELRGDRTLASPTSGTDGQRILVEVLAADADRRLGLDDVILLCTDTRSPIVIPAGRRWFGSLTHVGAVGWFLTTAALQR